MVVASGRAVASNCRDPHFESSHRQKFILNIVYCQLYWKDENKEKEAENDRFLKMNEKVAHRDVGQFGVIQTKRRGTFYNRFTPILFSPSPEFDLGFSFFVNRGQCDQIEQYIAVLGDFYLNHLVTLTLRSFEQQLTLKSLIWIARQILNV